ncbi:MAG: GNAT family N-acetyltransferase [Spirochaetales bacterium]|nr:GNAT family N-acetyltransferase [Spirochaetales bacterium]
MADLRIIDLTPETIADYGVCGYKDVKKHAELRNKIAWFREYYPKGLRIKALMAEDGTYQGMLEYLPGEYAHRPVASAGYMFIHCIFLGFKKEYKGRGLGSLLIRQCIEDARGQRMRGVAAVTREGSFMAGPGIFLKNGFHVVDTAKPDFSLTALVFDEIAPVPRFMSGLAERAAAYGDTLAVLRSVQCPYTEKNVKAILDSATGNFGLKAELVDLSDHRAAQGSPCPFGTFCIIHNGEVISHHPISATRFENIMKKRLGWE